ncbi:hypothetical protein DAEQUDRAFT_213117 [Daedalea quercina L-15889]|uniref:Uncharacterized protein n=1 Tax=Daedalea quercina L-15889 TaxID=1314783 RepID=A0A165KHC8_9APHY|nr:hypothetical protein DAEQUDRAFT_213117 [Daedalea quercina L-15889]
MTYSAQTSSTLLSASTVQHDWRRFLIGSTAGTSLVGELLAQFLYGVSLTQAMYYFTVYREDSRRIKTLVIWWMLLLTAKAIATLQALYIEIVLGHADFIWCTECAWVDAHLFSTLLLHL